MCLHISRNLILKPDITLHLVTRGPQPNIIIDFLFLHGGIVQRGVPPTS